MVRKSLGFGDEIVELLSAIEDLLDVVVHDDLGLVELRLKLGQRVCLGGVLEFGQIGGDLREVNRVIVLRRPFRAGDLLTGGEENEEGRKGERMHSYV